MSGPVLEFREVTKRFGSVVALDRVTFAVQPGEIFTLLGPSGCGKTTTLRLAAGLEEPDAGEILVNGAPVASPRQGVFVMPEKRHMGMVFQSYAIWPHLTVFENVAFPLRVRRESAATLKRRVLGALETVGLSGLQNRGAAELSGGQQQRVALARALVYAPSVVLLDEPLSHLDAKLREQMRFEIRGLQKRLGLTVLYVTHDQTEAMTLSDRIAVVHQARFEQVGTPADVYETPATSFVGEFLGRIVTFHGTIVTNHTERWLELGVAKSRLHLDRELPEGFSGGEAVRVFTRPEDVQLLPPGQVGPNELPAEIEEIAYLGDRFEYRVRAADASFVIPASKRERYKIGAPVRLIFDPDRLKITSVQSDQ